MVLGYSRQNYYKQLKHDGKEEIMENILKAVQRQRKILPRVGTRKLHYLISPELKAMGIKCGRDQLFKVLKDANLLVKPRKRYVKTTMSKHWLRKHPNIVKGLRIDAPEQVWVSDITHLKTDEGNCYLTLITDAYSRRIMGYNLADNMSAAESLKALQMAIKGRFYKHTGLIHHSDRGLQFCSYDYVNTAKSKGILMSMTEVYDPYENALAERMNRTIKEEFFLDGKLKTMLQAKNIVDEAIALYNSYRPHQALNLMTPDQVHKIPDKGLTRDLF